MKRLILLFVLALPMAAQFSAPPGAITVSTNPTGACTSPGVPLEFNRVNGNLYGCSGTGPYAWALVGGGGGGGSLPLPPFNYSDPTVVPINITASFTSPATNFSPITIVSELSGADGSGVNYTGGFQTFTQFAATGEWTESAILSAFDESEWVSGGAGQILGRQNNCTIDNTITNTTDEYACEYVFYDIQGGATTSDLGFKSLMQLDDGAVVAGTLGRVNAYHGTIRNNTNSNGSTNAAPYLSEFEGSGTGTWNRMVGFDFEDNGSVNTGVATAAAFYAHGPAFQATGHTYGLYVESIPIDARNYFLYNDQNVQSHLGGRIDANAFQAGGTFPTITGCGTISATSGGATAGQFTTSQTGTCTAVIPLPPATHGWTCTLQDTSKHIAANILLQSANSTTSCTLTGTTAATDVLVFGAFAW